MASRFVYSPDHDIYDGAPWTESSIRDLICRQGTIEEVRAKARELGLIP